MVIIIKLINIQVEVDSLNKPLPLLVIMNCSTGNCVFQKMNTFREQGHFTDVTFIIGGSRLKAHKNVLSCRSDVFEVMFTSPMTEAACGEVVITDASKEVFELFLSYLYLKTLDFKQLKAHYVVELLYLAEKYLMEGLRYRCVMEIENLVASGNLVYMLKVANSFNVKAITKKAVDIIYDHSGEVVESGELDELSKDFGLSRMLLSESPPATVSMQWSGNLANYSRNQYSLKQNFTIRNNGNCIRGEVELWYADTILHIFMKPIARDYAWDRPLEMSYWVKVLGSQTGSRIIHTSNGNLWWPTHQRRPERYTYSTGERPCPEELRRPLCDFEYDPDENVADDKLYFTVTLTQWDRPDRIFKKQTEQGLCKPAPSQEPICSSISPSAVDVNKFYSTSKKPLAKWITRSTYKKLQRYKSTKALPKDEDVDIPLTYAAKQHSCIDLQQHCETVVSAKLTVDNAVDTLIIAKDMCLTLLCSKTIDFINLNHLEVMATTSWHLLENHPDLVVSILKAVFIKPPDFQPFSIEPYPKFTLPHEDSEEEVLDEEEDSYDGGFLSDSDSDDEYYY